MTDADLHELIGARLCHDLISPVGAIGNGLELVMAQPVPAREDLQLLEQSARAAQAALAFNRLAFGTRGALDTLVAHREVAGLIEGHLGHGRLKFDFGSPSPDMPRPVAKMVLLAVLSVAGMAPFGGTLTLAPVTATPLSVAVSVTGRRVSVPEAAGRLLERGAVTEPLHPREVHYLLLHRLAAAMGAEVSVTSSKATTDDSATGRVDIASVGGQ